MTGPSRTSAPEKKADSRRSYQPAIVGPSAVHQKVGYRMLKSLSVENFRCFERFRLGDLRRINIVVGRNAAGKTALLESIRLSCGGTPTIAYTLSNQRGHPVFMQPNPTPEVFEAPWRPLFLNFDFKNEIKTSFTDSEGHTATLRVHSDAKRTIVPTQPVPATFFTANAARSPLLLPRRTSMRNGGIRERLTRAAVTSGS